MRAKARWRSPRRSATHWRRRAGSPTTWCSRHPARKPATRISTRWPSMHWASACRWRRCSTGCAAGPGPARAAKRWPAAKPASRNSAGAWGLHAMPKAGSKRAVTRRRRSRCAPASTGRRLGERHRCSSRAGRERNVNALYDLPAPAKVNLFLHVIGRRADGYHLLQSVFALIDWADTLHIERRSDGLLQRHDLTTPLPADDLCLRAARSLQQASGTTLGADIQIEKRVPSGAGLGGGSSDAATTLLALNRLWGLDWPRERLAALALT